MEGAGLMTVDAGVVRVLLVDDGDEELSSLVTSLSLDDPDLQRYQIDKVDNCEAALDEMMAGPFDLVMVAQLIGGQPGIETLRDILHSGYRAPVVLITAEGDVDARAAALAAGATDWVQSRRYSADLVDRLIRYARDFGRMLALFEHTRRCYRAAVKRDSGGTWNWNLENRKIRFGPLFKAQLGYTDDELPDDPDSWFNRMLPADAQRLRHAIRRLVQGEIPILELELRIQHRDRGYLWVQVRATLERDRDGHRCIKGTQDDINLAKLAEQRITWAERHDPLTGLLRRTAFVERLDAHLKTLRDGEDGGILCLCDVDGLKAINTTYGRTSGDEALLWLAGLVEDRVGDKRPVARLTGDKFAFLLMEPDVEAAWELVEEMSKRLARESFISEDGTEFGVSASYVIAPMPAAVEDATRWLDLADLRLADGQREGRPIVVLNPDAVNSALLETRKMQRVDLRARPRPRKKK